MRYRTSRSVAPASSGCTVTELCTENPVCFHEREQRDPLLVDEFIIVLILYEIIAAAT
jgi:hypothetical protein